MEKGKIISTIFFEYKLIEQIGEGGSGVVWKASMLGKSNAIFAIKILKEKNQTSEKFKRFKNEISFSLSHKHSNIIDIVDFGKSNDDHYFYVMQYFPHSLRYIINNDSISDDVKLKIFKDILEGVMFYQSSNIVHRDLKPENIFLSDDFNEVVIADFGIAHFEEDCLATSVETKSKERLANFAYAAPEQRVKGRKVEATADIYALGLILNELFTNTIPSGLNFTKISDKSPNLHYLDSIVSKALSNNEFYRYLSAKELMASIENDHPLAFRYIPDNPRSFPTHFWCDRMTVAFAGDEIGKMYTDKTEIINRLDCFFRTPLVFNFKDNHTAEPVWLGRGTSTEAITYYESNHSTGIVYLNNMECNISRLAVYPSSSDWRNWFYVELSHMPSIHGQKDPSPIASHGDSILGGAYRVYPTEEFAGRNAEYNAKESEVNGAWRNGRYEEIDKEKYRNTIRHRSKYNFIITYYGSPILENEPENDIENILDGIIDNKLSASDLYDYIHKLRKPNFYIH